MPVVEQSIQQLTALPFPTVTAGLDREASTLQQLISLPFDMWFGYPGGLRFRFKQPLRLRIYREGDTIIAHSQDLNEFGYGDSLSEALDDFVHTLTELYSGLATNAERLGADLREQFRQVSEYLEERPSAKVSIIA